MQDDEQYVENNENNLQQPIHIECEKPIYKINFCCFMFYNLFEWEEWNKKKKLHIIQFVLKQTFLLIKIKNFTLFCKQRTHLKI